MKVRPVVAELFFSGCWMDGQTDMTKFIVSFRNFAKAAEKKSLHDRKSNTKCALENEFRLKK